MGWEAGRVSKLHLAKRTAGQPEHCQKGLMDFPGPNGSSKPWHNGQPMTNPPIVSSQCKIAAAHNAQMGETCFKFGWFAIL